MASTSREAPPATTKTKSNFSFPSLVANLKAKFCKPKTVENKSDDRHRDAADAASSSEAANKKDDLGKTIPEELKNVASALQDHMNYMNSQIELAGEKFEKLQKNSGSTSSSERELEQLHRAIQKLKLQIPVQLEILSTTDEEDHPGGSAALSDSLTKLMHNDLVLADSTFAKAKEYMDHMSVKINEAWKKFKVLPSSPDPERDFKFKELRKAIKMIKVRIPSHGKIPSSNSNQHRNQWPNINGEDDVRTQFFHKEPEVPYTSDSDGLLNLESVLRRCLLCFFNFPPEATIKRSTMIYLWIALGYTSLFHERGTDEDTDEDYGNRIFDKLVEKGFIQPIYQNCSLVPHSCKMSGSVHSSLHEVAKYFGLTSVGTFSPDLGLISGHSFLINVGAPIITSEHENFFWNANDLKSLYLGRWQSSATHHIELADNGVLRGLEKMKTLKFLSLRGISMITELPTSMLKLNSLEMLDLRACHNLEAIPNDIGSLQSLKHLDMSECYFVEQMPKSLAQLQNLEVIKGFLVGDFQPCTLSDLARLRKIRKLNIYVSVKKFDGRRDFDDLKNFKALQKLTISWGGCSLQGKEEERRSSARLTRGPLTLPPRLQKLDLQCFPATCLTDWLRPAEIKQEQLKKLYIQGGPLSDIGQIQEGQGVRWNVKILRLKFLCELKLDGSKLGELFPELIYLYREEESPELIEFPSNKRGLRKIMEPNRHWDSKRGVWMNMEALHSDMQLQKLKKYLKMSGTISSSSMSGSDPTLAQDDSSICLVNEEHLH